jgi:hypothetical protein
MVRDLGHARSVPKGIRFSWPLAGHHGDLYASPAVWLVIEIQASRVSLSCFH